MSKQQESLNPESNEITSNNIIKINNHEYYVKKKMTVKQVRTAQELTANIIGLQQTIERGNEADLEQLAKDVMSVTRPQQQFLADTLNSCLGITQEQLDEMEFIDAALLFDMLFKLSTTIPKK